MEADQAVGLRLLPFASRLGVYGVGRSSGDNEERSNSSFDDVLAVRLWLFETASVGGTRRDAGATAAE